MRALVQRVRKAQVSVQGECVGEIGKGLLVFLGIGHGDTEDLLPLLWRKIVNMRIFDDEDGNANLSLADVNGSCMVVSQFTLYADCRKGRRPSFTNAMRPDEARRLYECFVELVRADLGAVAQGEFGAMMDVELVNDGPFTIWLDTDEL